MAPPPPAFGPGLTRYRLRRNPLTNARERALPEEVGAVHALPLDQSEAGLQIRCPQYLEKWLAREAACGAEIRVIMPGTFDPADSEACPTCAGAVSSASAYGTRTAPRRHVPATAPTGLRRPEPVSQLARERLSEAGRAGPPTSHLLRIQTGPTHVDNLQAE
jgi:hypothetical protein